MEVGLIKYKNIIRILNHLIMMYDAENFEIDKQISELERNVTRKASDYILKVLDGIVGVQDEALTAVAECDPSDIEFRTEIAAEVTEGDQSVAESVESIDNGDGCSDSSQLE